MDKVKIGVIGIGNMGSAHAKSIDCNKIKNLKLIAVCDVDTDKLNWASENLNGKVKLYKDYKEMIDSAMIDAVIIATPHYIHPDIAIYAFEKGLHVLSEKPAGVYAKQVEEMNCAAIKSQKVFSLMYNQRTDPLYIELKDIISTGKLGKLKRLVWIVTNWYRTQNYYDSGSWRGSWSGEGGGVLINQSPHNIDLLQWFFGMPKKITGFCTEGKYHNIEVEDDVTAYAEYENGQSAVFITSTGEYPGTNRLEISGEQGKAVIEDGVLKLYKISENNTDFEKPKITTYEIKCNSKENAHNIILQNFVNCILYGEKLIAPGIEGINGLIISNAINLSSWIDKKVTLPIDNELYLKYLNEKIKTSKPKILQKKVISGTHGTYSERWNVN